MKEVKVQKKSFAQRLSCNHLMVPLERVPLNDEYPPFYFGGVPVQYVCRKCGKKGKKAQLPL